LALKQDSHQPLRDIGMTRIREFLAIACALVLTAMPALAHHSFSAEFDARRPVRLEGVVSRVEFINPHVWIHVDARSPGI
jgi:hypothetical protein